MGGKDEKAAATAIVASADGSEMSPLGAKTLTRAVPVNGSTTTLRRPVSTGGPASRPSSTVCGSAGAGTSLTNGTRPSSRMKKKSTTSMIGVCELDGDGLGVGVGLADGVSVGTMIGGGITSGGRACAESSSGTPHPAATSSTGARATAPSHRFTGNARIAGALIRCPRRSSRESRQ